MPNNLLYIASSGLGENIFATHAMEFLAQTYEVHLVVRESFALFFKNYTFIGKVIEVPNNFPNLSAEAQCGLLVSIINTNDYVKYHSHNLHVMDKIVELGISRLAYFPERPKKLSCAEQYLLRAGGEPELLDARYKPVAPVNRDGVHKIVLYMGSREAIRRLPLEHYNNILEKLHKEYSNKYEVYCIYPDKFASVVHPYGEHVHDVSKNSQKIINLFASGVTLMIGPDSGLTHVALTFDVPQIWMETRDREEMAIPAAYGGIVKVFRVSSPICMQNCKARTHIKKHGVERMSHCPSHKEAVALHDLPCRLKEVSPCLSLTVYDYEELFALIASSLMVVEA